MQNINIIKELKKLINKFKRPFALKTNSMECKIPSNALNEEKYVLKNKYLQAYIYQQFQEIAKLYRESIAQQYKNIKSGNTHTSVVIPEQDFSQKTKTYPQEINEIYAKSMKDFQENLGTAIGKYNEASESNQSADKLLSMCKEIMEKCDDFEGKYRKEKIKTKNEFKKYLKQVNEGLKLAKKYGELSYKVDEDGNITSCDYNGKLLQYSSLNHNSITEERYKIITSTVIQHNPPNS